ncbi:MAG: SH3 domain-containing protein [Chloroflexi bacterium]|nr:SH3 domain-containing protein [Chloroflexota bacterium]
MKRFIPLIVVLTLLVALVGLAGQPASASNEGKPELDANLQSGAASWVGDFYNNPYFFEPKALSANTGVIAFNWGTNAPASGMSADGFSVRWGATPTFAAGTYRFYILADDEIAITLDFSNTIVNTLNAAQPGVTLTRDVTLTAGGHHIQVDYRENGTNAFVYLTWANVASNPTGPNFPAASSGTSNYGGTPTTPGTGGNSAVVSTNTLNVRSGPGTQFGVLAKIVRGEVVTLLGRDTNGTWAKVRLAGGLEGWVSTALILPNIAISSLPDLSGTVTTPTTPPVTGNSATVSTSRLNVRQGPGTSFRVNTFVVRGTVLQMLGRTADNLWVLVQLSGGQQGWVSSAYLIPNVPIGNLPITSGPVSSVPTATPITPTTNVWYGEFFNNNSLAAPVVYTRSDSAIAYNWGAGSPAGNIGTDNFSARFTSDVYFAAGTYRFTVVADDGVRFFLDNAYAGIDTFTVTQPGVTLTIDIAIAAGYHRLQLDYREYTSDAFLYFSWVKIS